MSELIPTEPGWYIAKKLLIRYPELDQSVSVWQVVKFGETSWGTPCVWFHAYEDPDEDLESFQFHSRIAMPDERKRDDE